METGDVKEIQRCVSQKIVAVLLVIDRPLSTFSKYVALYLTNPLILWYSTI
jgi:hypothetical protein